MLSPHTQGRAGSDGIHAILERIPLFEGVRFETIEFEQLGGALTNDSYRVTADEETYVLRLAGTGTSEYVDRVAEGHNARVTSAAGVNAEVLYFDARDGTMLSRFVDGENMDEGEGFERDAGAPARAALALKQVHGLGRIFKSRFDVFATIEHYLDLLRELRMPVPEDYHEIEQGTEAVRRALEASPVPLAPCHNDPWPGNLLDTGAGIYVIDWEYSGMNDPMWDLGDLSVEAGFELEQDMAMMEAYRGGAASPKLYSRLELYKAMSDLHWALWGFVQHANDNPAEDFRAYALERLEGCKTRMGSHDFGRHLSLVLTDGRPRTTPRRAYRTNPERRAATIRDNSYQPSAISAFELTSPYPR